MTLKLKRILISILCVLLCVCGAVALNFNATNSTFNASAEIIDIATLPDVQDFYMANTKKAFTSSIEIKVDPDDEQSLFEIGNGVILYPNDIAYTITSKEYSLNMPGVYTLMYFGEYEGREIIAKKSFVVIDSLYGLSATNTSFIDYATEEYLASQTDYVPRSKDAHNVSDTKLTHSGNEALSVNLEEGTEFIFSKPIDLRQAGSNGLTDLISFEPRAEDWDYGYVPYLDLQLNQVYDSKGRALYAQDYNKDGSQDVTNSAKYEDAWITPDTVVVGKKLYVPMLDEDGDGKYDVNIVKSYYAAKCAARNLVIKLTDCYDSTRFIKIIVSTSQSTSTATLNSTPYVRACTDNLVQDYGLWQISDSESHIERFPTTGTTNVKGVPNKVLNYPGGRRIAWTTQLDNVWHYGGKFGGYTYSNETFDCLNLKFDFVNSTIYACSTSSEGVETTPVPFTDFFNEELYPASLGGFRHFTTGEVYLSVGFEKYTGSGDNARVDIFKIGDTNVSDLFAQEGFDPSLGASQHKYSDSVAPAINVDFMPTVNGGVKIAVGDSFSIPAAEVFDINLVGDVSVNVYRNYNSAYQLSVPIVDGKIQIDYPVTYSIVYTARDKMNNIATKVIKVFGTNEAQKTVSIMHDTAQFTDIKAGYENAFVLPTSLSYLNLSDQLKLKIEIVSDFENVLIADLTGLSEIEDFLNSEVTYLLSYAGKYTINYYLSDNAYNNYDNPISHEFNVTASDKVVIYDEPFMYRHYIQDASYDFDKIFAYGFAKGAPEQLGETELWISYDGADFVKQDSIYNVKITGSQTIQVKYKYGDAVKTTGIYPIVDVDYSDNISTKKISFGNYFVGDFVLPDQKLDGSNNTELYYVSTKTEGNSLLQFVKPVDIANFQIAYRIDENGSNFNGIKFTLTDIYDANNKVVIHKYKEGNKFFVKFNEDSPKELEASFIGEEKSFAFTLAAQIIKVSNLTDFIKTAVEFTTRDAYLDIELIGITGDATIALKNLNTYSLKKVYFDRNTPSFTGNMPSGTFYVGDIVTISPATFTDDTSIIVKDKTSFVAKCNGVILRSVDGILLDGNQDPSRSYDVRMDVSGECSVQYSTTDNFGNKLSPTFYFSIVDNVAPEITFNGQIKEDVIVYAKPGFTVNLDFTMSDNITPEEALRFRIYVFNTHTAGMYAVSEKSFKLNYVGVYEVTVACYDADDNATMKTFTVVISNEEVK